MASIDLNADLGESYGAWQMGDDAALLAVVTSANVACGFHAGDPATMLATVEAALERGVAIGAHVSYPDLAGFGRREMDLAPHEVAADVLYQLSALDGIARAHGGRVAYVKPHGALYNRAAREPEIAASIATAIARYDPALPLMLLAGSPGAAAAHDVRIVPELFADRGYGPDGHLVPRSQAGAVFADADAVVERILGWIRSGKLTAADGSQLRIDAHSVCVHGDTPGAVAMARRLREALAAQDVVIEAF